MEQEYGQNSQEEIMEQKDRTQGEEFTGSQTTGYRAMNGYGYYYGPGSSYGPGSNYGQPGGYGGNANRGSGNNNKKGFKILLAILGVFAVLIVGILLGAVGLRVYYKVTTNSTMEKIQEKAKEKLEESGIKDLEESTEDAIDKIQQGSENISETGTTSTHTVAEIAEIGMPSVVAITNVGETQVRSFFGTYVQETASSGSGVIIGQSDDELLIVTNYHVIEGSEELSVVFSYQEDYEEEDIDVISAQIRDYDAGKDLAVISLQMSDLTEDNLNNIAIATIGDSDELVLGEEVVAIGNALGYGQSVTAGVISALSRTVTLTSTTGAYISNEYLQVDAAINPGNSGGALFNMYGELVGINSAKVASSGVEGMGYSIPISEVYEELEGMMSNEIRPVLSEEERGYLGIQGSNVTGSISSQYNLPVGAYISAVNPGSPAETAGLGIGMIITGLNSKKVTSMTDLQDQMSRYKAGETVNLVVQVLDEGKQQYQEREYTVTLGTREAVGFTENAEPEERMIPEEEQYSLGDLFDMFRY